MLVTVETIVCLIALVTVMIIQLRILGYQGLCFGVSRLGLQGLMGLSFRVSMRSELKVLGLARSAELVTTGLCRSFGAVSQETSLPKETENTNLLHTASFQYNILNVRNTGLI